VNWLLYFPKEVSKKLETISLDDKKAIVSKAYKLRVAGAGGATIEITVPKAAVEREARALGINEEAAVERLVGIWRYDSFRGLHLDFELKKEASK
jgi:hypothetical protein